VHDFCSFEKNPLSANRLDSTTDANHISTPYFTNEEAELVNNATVDAEITQKAVQGGELTEDVVGKTVQEAISIILRGFLEKRRAGGDARPCGPHHLAPHYAALFGITLEELKDERFLSRLRRRGV
jgi:hypothetical protein